MQTFTSSYCPEDNKLRLYSSSRLDKELYTRVKNAGFRFAPKQDLFVAPMWTPEREDLLIELCGEIEDEDKSLIERAEERSERFEDYSDRRAADAESAHKAVAAIADNIPFGQPILIGHHSERHARKDAERIENGMRRAVKMWDTAKYWTDRAASAIRHAKYKERPDVRARRIKTLEADKRKQDRYIHDADMWFKLWGECEKEQDKELQRGVALRLAGFTRLSMPRKDGDSQKLDQRPDAYTVLNNSYPELYAPRTVEEVITVALNVLPRRLAHHQRWADHYGNRIAYEKAMLGEAGGTAADQTGPQKGGGCRCWASPGHGNGWSYIQKVNKVSVTVLDNWGNGGGNFTRTIPFDKLIEVMTPAKVQEKREAGLLVEAQDKTGFYLLDTPPPTKKEEAEKSAISGESQDATTNLSGDIEAMRQSLKTGVQVVTAPQLFPTPAELAAYMVELAQIETTDRVLEPSAGTGNILRAIGDGPDKTAVEINGACVQRLATLGVSGLRIHHDDFLSCTTADLGLYDCIVMNPPFANGADIKHITHALQFLKPGGRFVALCANGPRQNERLAPMVQISSRMRASSVMECPRAAGTGNEQQTRRSRHDDDVS